MKKILHKILAILAKTILKKYQPKVVGITGSIGKTSAKEAVYAVLKTSFNVRKNIKNYNTEVGVPLTVIGTESAGRNLVKWLGVFIKALMLIILKNKKYPEILVLEMGADKPGDIEYLTKLAPCHVGVLTKIGPSHLEAFKTIDNVSKEKSKIVKHLDKTGFAILNFDDERVKKFAEKTEAKVISFGYDEEASVRALDFEQQGEGIHISGIQFKIQYEGSTVPVMVPNVIGLHQIYSALVAASVGLAFNMNLIQVAEGLKNYKSPKGRMYLVAGANNTLIIDDTYNSSPDAAKAALKALEKLEIGDVKRKVAILGDMLELGDYSEEAHIELGRKAYEAGVILLVCVGKNRELIAKGAKKAGLNENNVIEFEDSKLAREKIQELIEQNDLILIKGSQGARMERVVKVLMKEPERAKELLIRQTKEWV
jgi:UDP-N-acetylmuramoyl-tripeptide--D-alanyl-D-alanine ligase